MIFAFHSILEPLKLLLSSSTLSIDIWLTRFRPSTTSASTIDFTFPFELLFVPLLLPCIIKLVCLINFRAFGDSLKRSERGTVGWCWDGSLFDKFISGHILWISLIPSLTVDRLCILSSACSAVGTDEARQFNIKEKKNVSRQECGEWEREGDTIKFF